MAKFMIAAKKFVKGEEGATMVEYALMVALIAVICITTITAMSTSLQGTFGRITTALTNAGAA